MDYHEIEHAALTDKLEQLVTQWIEDHEEKPVELPDRRNRTQLNVRTPWNANNLHMEFWVELRGADLS